MYLFYYIGIIQNLFLKLFFKDFCNLFFVLVITYMQLRILYVVSYLCIYVVIDFNIENVSFCFDQFCGQIDIVFQIIFGFIGVRDIISVGDCCFYYFIYRSNLELV